MTFPEPQDQVTAEGERDLTAEELDEVAGAGGDQLRKDHNVGNELAFDEAVTGGTGEP
jgi:hypothetical protein